MKGAIMLNMTEIQFKQSVNEVIDHNPTIVEMKSNVAELKSDVAELKTEQHRQGLILEDVQSNMRTIAQAISPLLAKSEKIDRLETHQVAQRDEIEVTQAVLREHIRSAKVHRAVR